MLTWRTTFWLFIWVVFATALSLVVYRTVPSEGGRPRGRMLVEINVDDVEALKVETSDLKLSCVKRQGVWWLEQPIAARANDERIQRLLDVLALALVNDTISPTEQLRRGTRLADYGLDPPAARIVMEGSIMQPFALQLGGVASHGLSIYAGVSGNAQILVTDPGLLDALPTSSTDVRSRELLPNTVARLHRFELRSPGAPLVALERDSGGSWWLKSPEARPTAPRAVEAVLDYMTENKIVSFIAADSKARGGGADDSSSLGAPYGCIPDESPLVARFWFGDSSSAYEFHELVVGSAVRDAPDLVYVLSTSEQLVATVSSKIVKMLQVDTETLRDRRVWPHEPRAVRSVRLRGDAESVTIERSGTNEWVITQPLQAPAEQKNCAALVEALTKMRDVSVATSEPPERYDLLVAVTLGSGVCSTALVSRVEGEAGGGAAQWDWYIPDARELHRVDAKDMPVNFADTGFYAALRDPVMLRVAPEAPKVLRQQLGTNGVALVAGFRDGAWRMQEPEGGEPDIDRLNDIALRFQRLKATRVVALAPSSLEPYGLLSPMASLSCETSGAGDGDVESRTHTLNLGASTGEGGRFARIKGQASVFELADGTVEPMLRPIGKPSAGGSSSAAP